MHVIKNTTANSVRCSPSVPLTEPCALWRARKLSSVQTSPGGEQRLSFDHPNRISSTQVQQSNPGGLVWGACLGLWAARGH